MLEVNNVLFFGYLRGGSAKSRGGDLKSISLVIFDYMRSYIFIIRRVIYIRLEFMRSFTHSPEPLRRTLKRDKRDAKVEADAVTRSKDRLI